MQKKIKKQINKSNNQININQPLEEISMFLAPTKHKIKFFTYIFHLILFTKFYFLSRRSARNSHSEPDQPPGLRRLRLLDPSVGAGPASGLQCGAGLAWRCRRPPPRRLHPQSQRHLRGRPALLQDGRHHQERVGQGPHQARGGRAEPVPRGDSCRPASRARLGQRHCQVDQQVAQVRRVHSEPETGRR